MYGSVATSIAEKCDPIAVAQWCSSAKAYVSSSGVEIRIWCKISGGLDAVAAGDRGHQRFHPSISCKMGWC